jgi:hypothetical protein
MKTIELEILPNGEVRFNRQDKETNRLLFEFLSEIEGVEINDLKEFFLSAERLDLIVGNEFFCG